MSEKEEKQSVFKVIIFILLLIIIGLLIGIVFLVTDDDNDSDGASTNQNKALPQSFAQCGNEKNQINTKIDTSVNIFSELTPEEIQKVRTYMTEKENLQPYANRRVNQRSILFIDIKQPNKADVINYLDNNGNKPIRRAYVNVIESMVKVTMYEVWPVENPTNHRIVQYADRQNPAYLTTAPMYTVEGLVKIKISVTNSYRTLFDLFKRTYQEFENFTSIFTINIERIRITTDFFSKTNDTGRFLGAYYVKHRNSFPEELFKYTMIYFLFDISSNDTDQWSLYKVFYNNIGYDSVEELNQAFRNGTLRVQRVLSKTPKELEQENLFRKVTPSGMLTNSEPVIYTKNGPRFSVNGRIIEYFNWKFHYTISALSGPALFDVKYGGKRIAYEISLQDVALMHLSNTPFYSSGNVLLSLFLLGVGPSLVRGVDCPEHAVYLDSFRSAYLDETRITEGGICIFETVNNIPLKSNNQFATFTKTRYSGMNDNVLIVRFIHGITGFPTGFIFDYIFHQNGVVEMKATPKGSDPTDYNYKNILGNGFKVSDNLNAFISNDFVLYKVDLDIEGRENTFRTLQMQTKIMNSTVDSMPRLQQILEKNDIRNEAEAAIRSNEHMSSYFQIYNRNARNRYNHNKGYRIALQNTHQQLYPDNDIHTRQAEWSKYKLAVTRRKENENEATCLDNSLQQNNPPKCSFDTRINDNETIIQQDLVAWVTIGGLRIPTAESFPRIQSVGNSYSFFLQPFNYFDKDPSYDASDNVFLSLDGNDTEVSRQGMRKEASCDVPNKTYRFGKI